MKENIEKAVERLEKSINDVWFSTTYSQEDEERDLRVLLSDYKRVLKENEVAKEALKKQCDIADERNQLLKENEELKEEYKNAQACANMVFDKVIPVKKVKDKIEELEDKIQELSDEQGYWGGNELLAKMETLQGLLESEGK